MVNHFFFTQRQAGKDTVLLSIQTKILFCAKFTIADLRVFYCLEQLGTKEIAGKYAWHGRAIPLIG